MLWRDIIRYSYLNVKENKFRSVLILVNLFFAVASLVVTFALKSSMVTYINSQFEILGNNSVAIQCLAEYVNETGEMINQEDVKNIRMLYPDITRIECLNYKSTYLKSRNTLVYSNIYGTNHDYMSLSTINMLKGRYFNQLEEEYASDVVVISDTLAEKLFYTMDCIGHSIDLFNGNKMSRSYKIIGIYESMAVNSAITNSEVYPETIFIPIQSASFITGSDNIDILQFWMKKDVKGLRKISKDVVEYLELKHGIKNAYICTNSLDSQQQYMSIIDLISIICITLSFITFGVGSIGNSNIGMISVKERYGEIGILRSIGATKKDIVLLFMFESGILTVTGGGIGVGMGCLGAYIFSAYIGIGFSLDWHLVIRALAGVILLALLFGVFPAYHASRMKVLDAISDKG